MASNRRVAERMVANLKKRNVRLWEVHPLHMRGLSAPIGELIEKRAIEVLEDILNKMHTKPEN